MHVNQLEFKTYLNEYQVDSAFLLFDFQENKTLIYNEMRNRQEFIPASTFKILYTLKY